MEPFDIAFLSGIIASFVIFAVALAWVSSTGNQKRQ